MQYDLKMLLINFFGADGIITKAAGEGEHALARSFDMLSPDHQLKINSLVSGDLNQFKNGILIFQLKDILMNIIYLKQLKLEKKN